MKYYSDVLKKVFDTEDECMSAEQAYTEKMELAKRKAEEAEQQKKELAEKRKERAKEVEAAFKELKAAQEKYNDLLSKFLKDYKVYHYSGSDISDFPSLLGLWDPFFF